MSGGTAVDSINRGNRSDIGASHLGLMGVSAMVFVISAIICQVGRLELYVVTSRIDSTLGNCEPNRSAEWSPGLAGWFLAPIVFLLIAAAVRRRVTWKICRGAMLLFGLLPGLFMLGFLVLAFTVRVSNVDGAQMQAVTLITAMSFAGMVTGSIIGYRYCQSNIVRLGLRQPEEKRGDAD